MKLLIGLGNPGEKFEKNRHNVGKMFVEQILNSKFEVPNNFQNSNIKILKTDKFMNESGRFVAEEVRKHRGDWGNKGNWGDNLFIAHDDLDIPLGKFKIDFGVGPKVHNGLSSIEETLGTKDFWRVRIGVDAREPFDFAQGKKGKLGDTGRGYVLEDFTNEEFKILDNIFSKIWDQLKPFLVAGSASSGP